MKNKILTGPTLGIALLGLVGTASATTINFLSTDSAANKTSAYTYFDDFLLETFNDANLGVMPSTSLDQPWTWSAGGSIVTGSLSGVYAAPYGESAPDATNYLSVPNSDRTTSSVTAGLLNTYNYFGLWWGSVDAFNTLSFYKDGSLTESFSGADVKFAYATFGDQTSSGTNVYANFMDLGEFDTFTLTSTSMAFEVDNIAVGNSSPVPEPATMLLFGTGLVGVAGLRLRKKKR